MIDYIVVAVAVCCAVLLLVLKIVRVVKAGGCVGCAGSACHGNCCQDGGNDVGGAGYCPRLDSYISVDDGESSQ